MSPLRPVRPARHPAPASAGLAGPARPVVAGSATSPIILRNEGFENREIKVFFICLVLRLPWRVVFGSGLAKTGFELAKTGFELSKTGSELSKTGSFFFAWFLVLVLVPGCRVNNFFVRLRWFLYCKRWFLNWVLECGARTSHTKMVFVFDFWCKVHRSEVQNLQSA